MGIPALVNKEKVMVIMSSEAVTTWDTAIRTPGDRVVLTAGERNTIDSTLCRAS
jgi:hypothetical protein